MSQPATRQVRLTLDADIVDDLTTLAGGVHKRGAYVSELVRRARAEADRPLSYRQATMIATYVEDMRRLLAAVEAALQ